MSLGIFPQNPYDEPNKKNQPQKSPSQFPSIDEPTPGRNEDNDDDMGFDEGILNAN
jgi:hypothetical protein